jgi:hypothetical protein
MRASFKTLLVALAIAGCSIYDETSGGPSGWIDGASGSGGGSGSGGPSGASGIGGSIPKDGSSDTGSGADASDASGGSGTSGAAGTGAAGASGRGGEAGTGGASGGDGASGSGGTATTGGASGGDGASGSTGTSGAAGTSGAGGTSGASGAGGASGADASSGIDTSDAQPCVIGTGGPSSLPFAVDQYFVASGWMQATLIGQDATCTYPPPGDAGSRGDGGTLPPLPGSKCWTITYTPTAPTDWAGVDWQYPINNWGASPGLVIPPGAARVSLVAWGDTGSEIVSFNVGYGPATSDTFSASLNNQVLSTSPTRFAVDMSGIAYTCNSVRMGFGWVASGGTAMTFHLADLRWE